MILPAHEADSINVGVDIIDGSVALLLHSITSRKGEKMKHLLKKSLTILMAGFCFLSMTSCSKPVVEEEKIQSGNITDELSPSPEKVSLSVDDCLYDGEIEVTVSPIKIQKNEAEGWKTYGYDVSSDELKEGTNGYFEIRIPYDESFIMPGEDPNECLCAKCFNEETEQWEYELCEVDEENKEVVVLSSHLSKHAVMMFKDKQSASKYGVNLNKAFDDYQSLDEAMQTMRNFIDDTLAWDDNYFTDKSAIEVALDAFHGILCPIPEKINNHIYDSTSCLGSAAAIATLGSGFENSFFKKAFNRMSKLGLYTSVCKLSLAYWKGNKSRDEILDLYSTLISTTVDLFGYAAEGLGPSVALSMSGFYVVSVVISEMFEEAKAIKMENMAAVYEYFGDQYESGKYSYRKNKEWYDIFMDIFDRYTAAGKQEFIEDAIEREIRLYAEKFWELDADTVNEVIDDAGYKRMPYPSQSEIDQMTSDYINNLHYRLTPILSQCEKTMLLRQKEKAMKMLQTCFNYCNSPLTLELYDKSEDKSFKNCLYRFKGLGPNADDVFNAGKLDDGKAVISFTFAQYMNAGGPTQIELFEDEKAMEENKPCSTAMIVPCQNATEPSYAYFLKESNETVYFLAETAYIAHDDSCAMEQEQPETCIGPNGEETACIVAREDCGVSDTEINDSQIIVNYKDEYGNAGTTVIDYPGRIIKDIVEFNNFNSSYTTVFDIYTNKNPDGQTIYYSNNAFLTGNISSCIEDGTVCISFDGISLKYVQIPMKESEGRETNHIDIDGYEYGRQGKWK